MPVMSWQERILSLGKQFGPGAAKTAVNALLAALVPGGALLSDLVDGAFSAAYKTEQDARYNQLEEALQIVQDDLGEILAQLGEFREQPEEIARILKLAKENDRRCIEASEKLSKLQELCEA